MTGALDGSAEAYAEAEFRRRARLLSAVVLGSLGALAAIDGSILYYSLSDGPAYAGVPFSEFSVFPAFFVFLYALVRRGFLALASWLLVAGYALCMGYAAYEWGTDIETTVLGSVILGIIASILIGARTGFLAASVSAAAVVPIWYAELHHIVPAFGEPTFDLALAAVVFAVYALVAVVIWRGDGATERSLAEALRAEAELKERLRAAELENMEHLDRLAEFGRLSSGLFHDLMNVVNGISLENELSMGRRMDDRIGGFAEAVRRELSNGGVKRTFSLFAVAEQAIGLLGYKARAAGVNVRFDHCDGDPLLWFGSDSKFQRVVMNLVSNAIESGGRNVGVRIFRERGDFVLSVKDDGKGIPQDIRNQIFEPFFTTKDGGSDAGCLGAGLGLAIAKRAVEEDLKGTIAVESDDGKGATFTVRFPASIESRAGF